MDPMHILRAGNAVVCWDGDTRRFSCLSVILSFHMFSSHIHAEMWWVLSAGDLHPGTAERT